MFDKIIVGVDGSEGGADAIVLAKALGGPAADIVLVTAYPYERAPGGASLGGYADSLRADAQAMLDDAVVGDDRCQALVVDDWSPARGLHRTAEEQHADLIVIGSAHRGPIGRVLLGDVSRNALHGAPCPVAIAPRDFGKGPAHAIRTIGVGVNGTPQSDAALAVAAGIAAETGATLRVLTAVAPPAAMAPSYAYAYDWTEVMAANRLEAGKELEATIGSLKVPAEPEVVDGDAGRALEDLSEHVDLVVAGSRGWGAGRSIVLGSTTDRLTHHAHCPVLVIPSPAGDREAAHA